MPPPSQEPREPAARRGDRDEAPGEARALGEAAPPGDDGEVDADRLQGAFLELRRLARAKLERLPPGQTLQPTALVHEAYLRLYGKEATSWQGREDFLFLAARAMHDVLVEAARRKASLRRGGAFRRRPDFDLTVATEASPEGLLALDEALEKLARGEPRKAELVRLRFFVGLSEEETAEALGVSVRTVSRQWRFVRTWLYQELQAEDDA